MAKTSNRRINIFLNGKAVEGSIKDIRKEWRKLKNEAANAIEGSDDYIKKTKRVAELGAIIDRHNKKLRGIDGAYKKVSSGLSKYLGLAAAGFGIREIVNYGRRVLDLGIQMDTLGRKAQTVFGEVLPLVTRQAEENAQAMGLTTSQYVDAAAAMQDLLVPMGFQREEAANISTELVNLSGALSEWTGGQRSSTEVAEILQKALLGEREQLKSLGISIQEADVKARLAEKGLKGLTGEMLQQAKASATLELIMEKTTDAQAAFADGTDKPIRNMAELSAKLTEIQEKVAQLLIPIFGRLVSLVNNFVGAINDYLDISVEEKINQEKEALNLLVNQITQTNISQEERNKLIGTLQKDYPAFLTNLDTEKVTNEELGKRLSEVNNQYILKIALQKEDEKIQNKAQQIASNERAIAEQRVNALELTNRLNLKYKLGLDLTNKSLEEQTQLVKEAIDQRDDVRINSMTRAQLNLNTTRTESVAIQKDELEGLKQRRKEIEANIKSQLGIGDVNFIGGNSNQSSTKDKEEELRRAAEAEKKAKERQKEAERELKDLEKKQERLAATVEKFREESRINDLSEDEQKLERLRQRYDKEIAIAKELEAQGIADATEQRIELERLKEVELNQLRDELLAARTEKEKEQEVKHLQEVEEAKKAEKQRQIEEQQAIQAFLDESNLNQRQLELLQLEEQFNQVADLTSGNDEQLLLLLEAYRKKKQEINEKFDKSDRAQYVQAQKAQAEALAASFNAAGNVIGGIMNAIGEESLKKAKLDKALALTQIGISSAEAIAKGTAASAGIPFPANLGAIATTIATVLANIGQARQIINQTRLPQKKKGGWLNARGQDDGVTYRAQYIGSPNTGMLPSHPVVLASESGPEYFVSNKALENPYVLNHVRAIENITSMRQFREGGATEALPTSSTPTPSSTNEAQNALMVELKSSLDQLSVILANGIFARYDDDEIINFNKKFNELNSASGGTVLQ